MGLKIIKGCNNETAKFEYFQFCLNGCKVQKRDCIWVSGYPYHFYKTYTEVAYDFISSNFIMVAVIFAVNHRKFRHFIVTPFTFRYLIPLFNATILYPLTILLPKYHISKLFQWKGLILIQVLEFLNLIDGCGVYIIPDIVKA